MKKVVIFMDVPDEMEIDCIQDLIIKQMRAETKSAEYSIQFFPNSVCTAARLYYWQRVCTRDHLNKLTNDQKIEIMTRIAEDDDYIEEKINQSIDYDIEELADSVDVPEELEVKHEFGIWTPWASLICYDCHGDSKLRKPDLTLLEVGKAITKCDSCKKLIQIDKAVALENNLVLALHDLELHAEIKQLGGMTSAVNVKLNNGHCYKIKFDYEGIDGYCLFEYDLNEDWIQDNVGIAPFENESTNSIFKSQQEIIDYLHSCGLVMPLMKN